MSDAPDPILDAAARLLAEGRELTMGAVARAANVSRGTVYRRHGDRETLLARLAEVRGTTVDALGADSRGRALDAVADVIVEAGPGALTVDAVARRAGLSPATVYRHFGDRKGLLAAFGAERTPRRLSSMLDRSDGDDMESDLTRLARDIIDFAFQNEALVRLIMSNGRTAEMVLETAPGGPRRVHAALGGYFERQIRSGRLTGDPGRLTVAFGALILGLVARDRDRTRAEPDDAARFVARTLIHGWSATRP